jgi:ABC-type glycerol-3-phosphate transport system permease component
MTINMQRVQNNLKWLALRLVLLAGAIWALFPFVWMVLTSLKS